MFAPRLAKQKTKSSEFSRTPVVSQQHGQSALSPVQLLQRRIGNQALMRYMAQRQCEPGAPHNAAALLVVLQPKLKIGAVNDPLEHEVDSVADQVMRMPAPESVLSSAPTPIAIQPKLAIGSIADPLEREADSAAERHGRSAAAGLVLQRQPTFAGDGMHLPTDVAYATTLGQADAARLRKAGTLSAADRAGINAKLRFFQPPAWEAYGKEVKPALSEVTAAKPAGQEPDVEPFTDAQLERMGQVAQVNVLFTQIQALKNDRVKTWTDTATAKEPKPLQYALDLVVAMVGLGMGGVLGMLVSKGIKGEYLSSTSPAWNSPTSWRWTCTNTR